MANLENAGGAIPPIGAKARVKAARDQQNFTDMEKKIYGIVEGENHVYLYNLPKPKKFISEDGEILWVKGDFCGSYIAREEDNLKIGDMVEIIIKKISQNHE